MEGDPCLSSLYPKINTKQKNQIHPFYPLFLRQGLNSVAQAGLGLLLWSTLALYLETSGSSSQAEGGLVSLWSAIVLKKGQPGANPGEPQKNKAKQNEHFVFYLRNIFLAAGNALKVFFFFFFRVSVMKAKNKREWALKNRAGPLTPLLPCFGIVSLRL